MPALYRICLPELPYIEPLGLRNPNFVTDQVFAIQEPEAQTWAPILNILIPGLLPYLFNYSIIDGSFERGKICLNSLLDNTSDIVFMPADLPINNDLIGIYGIIGQSKLQFQSSYNYTDKSRNVDVIESVTSFKPSLWLLILFLLFLFAWLMRSKQTRRICRQNLRKIMDSLDQVTTHFIGQNSFEGEGFFLKILIITLSFFSLMINLYYNGLIHTDLIVPEVPRVPYTYQDFASIATVSGFPTGASVLKYFEGSPQDSPERSLYNELRHRNQTIGDGLPVHPPAWAKITLRTFYDSLYRLKKYHVTIGRKIEMMALVKTICWAKVYSQATEAQESSPTLKKHFAPKFKNIYPWASSDPNTSPTIHAFIKRKEFIPDTKIWKRVKRSIEHGMFQRIIWTAETFDLTEGYYDEIEKRPVQMRECLEYSRRLKIKEVGFENLKVVNFEKFARVFLVLFSVCYMALIIEVYIYTYTYRE